MAIGRDLKDLRIDLCSCVRIHLKRQIVDHQWPARELQSLMIATWGAISCLQPIILRHGPFFVVAATLVPTHYFLPLILPILNPIRAQHCASNAPLAQSAARVLIGIVHVHLPSRSKYEPAVVCGVAITQILPTTEIVLLSLQVVKACPFVRIIIVPHPFIPAVHPRQSREDFPKFDGERRWPKRAGLWGSCVPCWGCHRLHEGGIPKYEDQRD